MLSSLFDGLDRDKWDRHNLHVTDVLDRKYEGEISSLARRIDEARRRFPALRGVEIIVTRDRPDRDRNGATWPFGRVIMFPVDHEPSNVTIYHELGHVAIVVRIDRGEDLPRTSEEFCGIWSMAKMPATAVDERKVPYCTKPVLDKEILPEVCRQVLRYREDHQDYIQQCNRWLNGRWHSRDDEYRGESDV